MKVFCKQTQCTKLTGFMCICNAKSGACVVGHAYTLSHMYTPVFD